jgi:uncharacterized phage-associated protein
MTILQREINSNSTSVHSDRGDGNLGHLVLTMPIARYNALVGPNNLFVVPVNPGPHPIFPANATAAMVTETTRIHTVELAEYRTYTATDRALRALIIAACPLTYIKTLQDRELGFTNVTTIALLTHLWTNYGTIEPGDISENTARMTTPWHPPSPIEDLFDQIEKATEFATAANSILPESLVVETAYNLVAATGLFTDDCKAWRARPIAQKTWDDFKIYFLAQSKDRSRVTTSTAGFHSANSAVTDLAAANAKYAALEKKYKALTKKAPPSATATPTGPKKLTYCWSHGISSNVSHTSMTCKKREPGHREDATMENRLLGSDTVWSEKDARPRAGVE